MSKADVVTVMVADDHSLFRAGLRELLEEDDISVVGEASNGDEAVRQALHCHPDVVVMDVRMPVMDGIEASRKIKQELPSTEIVMISGVDQDEEHLFQAIDAGARAYVGKDEAPEAIIEAVRNASQGEAYLPPSAMKLLLDHIANEHRRPGAGQPLLAEARLTQREKDVLRLLAKGRHNQEIAEELGLSVRSVGNHLAKIYNKLHIHGRAEAVLYAVRNGIASF